MTKVGIYEAKTHFAKLMDRVARGEVITVTRHGKPIATITSSDGGGPKAANQQIDIVNEFRKIRRTVKPGPSIIELIREGRRF